MNPTVMPFKDDKLTLDADFLPSDSITFTNCRLCISGSLSTQNSALMISKSTGKILEVLSQNATSVGGDDSSGKVVDLNNAIVAPGFLELQTNGMIGFHFTHFEDEGSYAAKVDEVAKYLPTTGVTGFWATVPTVESGEFKKVRMFCPPQLSLPHTPSNLSHQIK